MAVAEDDVNVAEVEADESRCEEKLNKFRLKVVNEFYFEIVVDGHGGK